MDADLCFVIDCTGKEKKCAKANLLQENLFACNCVDYDDIPQFEVLDFTENINEFKDFLGKLTATGGGDDCEDVIGGLEKCVGLKWSSKTKVLFHIADAPPHNRMYHDGAGDNHPDDTKRDHTVVLRALQKKRNLRYYIGKLNDSVNKMIRVFKKTGYEMNLIVEEHEMPDVKNLFESVVRSVTDAINAIRVSKNRALIFMFFFLGVLFTTTLITKKMARRKKTDVGLLRGKRKRQSFKAFVGIDFGTDGTGVAYSFPEGKVYTSQKWPGRMLAEVKNKTNLLLDKDGNFVAFGQEATDRYTSSVDSSLEFYERFKMALYNNVPDEIDDGKYDDDTKEQDLEPYLTAANGKKRKTLDVLKQVFTFLREYVMNILKSTTLVERIEDVQWVITVPAIWSNTAKNSMREAAHRAGLISDSISDHLLIAFEPECGSVVARRYCHGLKKGDKYILLDLGGGTADIACHRVLDEKSVSQIYAPSGGPWGSTYIDDAFWGLLCEIFGREIMEEFKTKYSNEHVQLIENFKQAKHSYNPTSPDTPKIKTHKVSLEDIGKKVKEHKLKDKSGIFGFDKMVATLTLGHEGWKFLMDKVIDPLIKHISDLLAKPELRGCEAMLCVGGLSTSSYVTQRLRDVFVTDCKVIKTITKPEQPILAVMEGAALFGMTPSLIAEYVMMHTYGLKCARFWANSDGEEGKLWSEEDGRYIFEDGFEIFARKNTKLNVHDPPIVQYFQPLNRGATEIVIEIYCSDEENPKRCTDETLCARVSFQLPSDWWEGGDAEDKEIPIAFYFNRAEIQVKVELENYSDKERCMKIKWLKGV
ncbi:hypothetical protein RFI_27739 [Reticulomyxa filosa]|uniref:Uncharacterized protein n=1 Tax=Reticulomyxa filosa TaxID=46433 RepID=X6M851_RETFI|nr:hypothetical protein RFI_27739 [Reticulomyxa filosa]|eukprot:ETO09642.1 hypothetical protein RFI_27739 [Reticulomyxa filosa]